MSTADRSVVVVPGLVHTLHCAAVQAYLSRAEDQLTEGRDFQADMADRDLAWEWEARRDELRLIDDLIRILGAAPCTEPLPVGEKHVPGLRLVVSTAGEEIRADLEVGLSTLSGGDIERKGWELARLAELEQTINDAVPA